MNKTLLSFTNTVRKNPNVSTRDRTIANYVDQSIYEPDRYLEKIFVLHKGNPPMAMVLALFFGGDFPESEKELRKFCNPLPEFWLYDDKTGKLLCHYFSEEDALEDGELYKAEGCIIKVESKPRILQDLIDTLKSDFL